MRELEECQKCNGEQIESFSSTPASHSLAGSFVLVPAITWSWQQFMPLHIYVWEEALGSSNYLHLRQCDKQKKACHLHLITYHATMAWAEPNKV